MRTGQRGWRDELGAIDPAWLSLPVGLIGAAAVFAFAPVGPDATKMLAITAFSIALWIGTPIEPWLTALGCIGLIGVAFSSDLALTGFQSPATWLVVVGILVGVATQRSGLADLAERVVRARMPARTANDGVAVYRHLLVTYSIAGFGLAFLVPSALVRVLILGPILVSLTERFADRRAKLGIFLGPLFVTFYASTGVLTGSLSNIIVTGLVESSGGPSISWTEWLAWMGPVMGVGRMLVVLGVALLLYRPRDPAAIEWPEESPSASLAGDQRRMLAFLLVGVCIWATDVVHGLHPLYGALVVAILAFTPRIGVVGPDAIEDANFSILFFMGAIFAIAEGLRRTGFTDLAAGELLAVLPEDASIVLVLAFVVFVAMALALLMEGLAVASVLTPVLVSFAASAGVPVTAVAMIEAAALNAYFFPYQSAVLVAILGLGVVDTWELTRMASICTVCFLLLVFPLQIAVFAFFL